MLPSFTPSKVVYVNATGCLKTTKKIPHTHLIQSRRGPDNIDYRVQMKYRRDCEDRGNINIKYKLFVNTGPRTGDLDVIVKIISVLLRYVGGTIPTLLSIVVVLTVAAPEFSLSNNAARNV